MGEFLNCDHLGVADVGKWPLLHIWCRLLPHASLTLNLLCQSHMNPKLSGYEKRHGDFNYNATPLAHLGIQVIVYEKKQ